MITEQYGIRVDTDSPEFIRRITHVFKFSGADTYDVVAAWRRNPEDPDQTMDIYIIFQKDGFVPELINSIDLMRNVDAPRVAAGDLRLHFALEPLKDGEGRYEPVVEDDSPIGEQWISRGARVFRVKQPFDEQRWPLGSTWVGKHPISGLQVKFTRTMVVVTPGQGPFGSGAEIAPAWTISDNQ